jgi:hypothetical protein
MGRKDSIGQARFIRQTEGGLSAGMTGYFRLRRGALTAEGRFIPMILLILSNFPLKMRIHSFFS